MRRKRTRPRAPGLTEARSLDWRRVTLRRGALFVVGDPKQSIYRFRRADIDIYNEVRERLGGPDGQDLVRLTTNFRSVPGLCDWANDVFKQRFPKAPTPQAPAFGPLVPDPNRKAASGPHLAVIDIPATVKGAGVAAWEADADRAIHPRRGRRRPPQSMATS